MFYDTGDLRDGEIVLQLKETQEKPAEVPVPPREETVTEETMTETKTHSA